MGARGPQSRARLLGAQQGSSCPRSLEETWRSHRGVLSAGPVPLTMGRGVGDTALTPPLRPRGHPCLLPHVPSWCHRCHRRQSHQARGAAAVPRSPLVPAATRSPWGKVTGAAGLWGPQNPSLPPPTPIEPVAAQGRGGRHLEAGPACCGGGTQSGSRSHPCRPVSQPGHVLGVVTCWVGKGGHAFSCSPLPTLGTRWQSPRPAPAALGAHGPHLGGGHGTGKGGQKDLHGGGGTRMAWG